MGYSIGCEIENDCSVRKNAFSHSSIDGEYSLPDFIVLRLNIESGKHSTVIYSEDKNEITIRVKVFIGFWMLLKMS